MFNRQKYIFGLLISFLIGSAAVPSTAIASQMFLEYSGELTPGYSFYRGAFDLGDLDNDGSDEMVIADDRGGYHVYHYSPDGFIPIWVSDPLIMDGYIVEVEIIHENIQGIMPHIMLLDSLGTLHQVRFTGYMFVETERFENFSASGTSGRLIINDLGEGEKSVIIAIQTGNPDEMGPPSMPSGSLHDYGEGNILSDWEGLSFFRLTDKGLEDLTDNEFASLEDGEVYIVTRNLGDGAGGMYPEESDPFGMLLSSEMTSGRAGLIDLDRDELYELLITMSDPVRPVDRLEIFNEQEDVYSVKITVELPLINEMVLGDVDGDGFTEIVSLTYDGNILVYQWDPLQVVMPNGMQAHWEAPHRLSRNSIWMSVGCFIDLGCSLTYESNRIVISYGQNNLALDTDTGTFIYNDTLALTPVPPEFTRSVIYLPFFRSLDLLGFKFIWDPYNSLVEIEPGT